MITTRIHLFNVLPAIVFYTAGFFVGLVVFLVQYATDQAIELQIFVQGMTLIAGTMVIRTYLAWLAYVVIVRPQGITIQQGILLRRRDFIALQLATVHVNESVADRALNRGSLCVTAANGEQYTIGPIGAFRQVCGVLGM